MGLCKPIETVVIHDLVLRPRPGPDAGEVIDAEFADSGSVDVVPDPGDPPDGSSQRREKAALLELLKCDTRESILIILAEAACPEPVEGAGPDPAQAACREPVERQLSVTEIAHRAGMEPKKISAHLAFLRPAGLVIDHPAGQCRLYEADPRRVEYTTGPAPGQYCLTLRSRRGDVAVRVEVGREAGT